MKAKKFIFNEKAILETMESMRRPNGAFVAAPKPDYWAMWHRDHLYCTYSYWYLSEYEKLKQGINLSFDVFHKYKKKIIIRISTPEDIIGGAIHAKVHPDTLEEITEDNTWGHHQLDVLGLFLHVVSDLHFKNVPGIIRDERDAEMLQLLVAYLRSVEYWTRPDFGLWEECKIRHLSSIGSVIGGLKYIRKQNLAIVREPLIACGETAFLNLYPQESRDYCGKPHHNHEYDAAELTLIWPYHVIADLEDQDKIISQLIGDHVLGQRGFHRLLQTHGLNRYWGDDYYRSTEGQYRGISAEWPLFKFWISIIYSQRHEYDKASAWFREGCKEIKDNKIPEAYQNGEPNDHFPLAWAHAIALIAWKKLPREFQVSFLP